jgi:hypothetical protein
LVDRIECGDKVNEVEFKQYLQIINNEALRCRDIVENLSKFAREGATQIKNVNLYDCLVDALKLTNSRMIRKNIQCINRLPNNIRVNADVNKLEQVIINIISNSIDFCPENSIVEISSASSREPSRYYAISLTDNGPGIDSEDLPNVFDPFFTTKEVGQGIGMGLATCYRLMEECNGSIDIVSEKGIGTTVILEIPIVSETN